MWKADERLQVRARIHRRANQRMLNKAQTSIAYMVYPYKILRFDIRIFSHKYF